jgi:ABC-2 type transport system permease protein
MTLIKHELKKGYKSLAIWTLTIGFFVVICVLMFPEMKGEMEDVSEMFSSMGAFTQAFGMDKLNFGTLMGFYAIECGNILGLGGAFYAAILGITALAKEEKERTAEFLLSHPISRNKIITEKLIAIFIQIITMNVLVFFMSVISIVSINEEILWR